MKKQTKILLTLIPICLIDLIVPLPIIGLILVYVVLEKPVWFRTLVQEIYDA